MSETRTDPSGPAGTTSGSVDPQNPYEVPNVGIDPRTGALLSAEEDVDPYAGMTEGQIEFAEMQAAGVPINQANDPTYYELTGIDPQTGEQSPELQEAIAADIEAAGGTPAGEIPTAESVQAGSEKVVENRKAALSRSGSPTSSRSLSSGSGTSNPSTGTARTTTGTTGTSSTGTTSDSAPTARGNAGTPGNWEPSGSKPKSLNDLSNVDANPRDKWNEGDSIKLEDGSDVYWDGSSWKQGKAPA